MNQIERIIKNVVEKNYPVLEYNFLVNETMNSVLAVEAKEENTDKRAVGDGSGRQYFMWGISKWGDGDIIAE